MWLKTRKLNAVLSPLAPVIDGEASNGRLEGSYRGYAVEARPHSGYPVEHLSTASSGEVEFEAVNMLRVALAGVAGSQYWHCQSSPSSYLHGLTSRFTAGPLLNRFKPGEFKFEGVDTLMESVEGMGEKLVQRLGMPIQAKADSALQGRLIAAGVFNELDALRLGAHPYLPKIAFFPGGRALAELFVRTRGFSRGQAAIEERLLAAGLSDYRSLIEERMAEIDAGTPGRLELDVEAGKAKAPGAEQFREVLEHAVRIAHINAEVNRTS